MTKFILAAAMATGLIGFVGVAQADMGIPNLAAQPLTTQVAVGVVGEAMPHFTGPARPVVSEQFAQSAVGEDAPSFTAPTQGDANGAAYAQIGRPQKTASVAVATGHAVQQHQG